MPPTPPLSLTLVVLPGLYACLRLGPGDPIPAWAHATPFSSITRSADELSIICPEASAPRALPEGGRAQGGFRVLKVRGPLPFTLTGVIAAIAGPLAAVEVGLVPVATFDTDYILIQGRDLEAAVGALIGAGHRVEG